METGEAIDLTIAEISSDEEQPKKKKKKLDACSAANASVGGAPPPPPPPPPGQAKSSAEQGTSAGACADPAPPPSTPAHLINLREQSTGRARPRFLFAIGRGRHVSLSHFSGRTTMQVREYRRQATTDLLYPTPIGVTLSPETARALMYELPHMITCLQEVEESGEMRGDNATVRTWYLGDRLRATIDVEWGNNINLRHFFVPQGATEEYTTRRGVRLNLAEMQNLLDAIRAIEGQWPALAAIRVPCYVDHSMQENQEAILNCPRCTPML